MIAQSNPRLTPAFSAFARGASVIPVLVGCFVLGGWASDIEALKRVLPGLVAMNPITALLFILAGATLWFLRTEEAEQRTLRIWQVIAGIIALVGLVKLGGIVFGWDTGIDQMLFRDKLGAVGNALPNRMAPTTALSFTVAGCALLLLDVETRWRFRPAQFLSLFVFLIALLAFIGYLYGVKRLTGFAAFIPMALHTAVTFMALSAGILFARPTHGLMARLANETVGGNMVRRLLPLIIGIPLALGWAILAGQRASLYDAEFGFSIFVVLVISVFSIMIWTNAISLDRKENERGRAEDALREAHDELERRVEVRTADLSNVLLEVRAGINVLGFSASEILAANTQVASSAEETAAAVNETTATIEEVKQTAQLSSQQAAHVSEGAQQAAQVSQSGKRAVGETIEGMSGIKEQMESIAESVVRLSEHNLAIGGIIATVNDLAEQTDLLAVNAAIEAAKAGDEGKGFTVVAQEIRSLAEQSKQATAQVRTILSDIHTATTAAVRAAVQGSAAVAVGMKQSNDAGESIQMLTESISDSAQAATQIAASSRQQLAGMDQVTLAMESIKQASTENVSNTKHAETSARNLHELGQKLKDLVEQYQV